MAEPPYVALTDRIAEKAHQGQTDKNGVPYIEHPRAVARIVVDLVPPEDRWIAISAALLHDVLEDTDLTPSTLELAGVPLEVIEIVKDVTKKPHEETAVYLARVMGGHRLSLAVKMADMTHNRDEERLMALDVPTQERLRAKYSGQWGVLLAEMSRRQVSSWSEMDA
jgi:(p)ppGpp synthase/HD superfamily hydrolase